MSKEKQGHLIITIETHKKLKKYADKSGRKIYALADEVIRGFLDKRIFRVICKDEIMQIKDVSSTPNGVIIEIDK